MSTLTYAAKALTSNPNNFAALQCRTAANCMLSNLVEAIADAERGLYLFPNDVHCWLWKGTAHFHLKEYAEAAAAFRRGLQYEPTHARLQRGDYASHGWLKKLGARPCALHLTRAQYTAHVYLCTCMRARMYVLVLTPRA